MFGSVEFFKFFTCQNIHLSKCKQKNKLTTCCSLAVQIETSFFSHSFNTRKMFFSCKNMSNVQKDAFLVVLLSSKHELFSTALQFRRFRFKVKKKIFEIETATRLNINETTNFTKFIFIKKLTICKLNYYLFAILYIFCRFQVQVKYS